MNLLDQAEDGFPDADAALDAYIIEAHAALRRYQERMMGRLPVPVLTPAQRSLARRVRCLKAAEDQHLARMGLQRPPRVPSRVRATA